jgi:hypothetical protein
VAREEERAGLLAALRALAGAGLSHTHKDELILLGGVISGRRE